VRRGLPIEAQELILEELKRLNERVGTLREDLSGQLDRVSRRLDKVIENTGAHWRGLDRRVAALERSRSR
jgi:hypothetical protein